jgi:pimeloyl-ACP methyl ester carboxylesterase
VGQGTSKHAVKELATLLQKSGIPGPYVLVGASSGAFNIRLFANEYPDQVAGLVFVDGANEDAFDQMPEVMKQSNETMAQMANVMKFLAPLGIARLFIPPNETLPEELRKMDHAMCLRTPHIKTACEEGIYFTDSIAQMKDCTLPSDIPLAVLSASEWTVFELTAEDTEAALDAWIRCQAEFAKRSTNSFHLVVPDSGHEISNYQPAVVIDAIRRVVESVRNQTKLVAPEL